MFEEGIRTPMAVCIQVSSGRKFRHVCNCLEFKMTGHAGDHHAVL